MNNWQLSFQSPVDFTDHLRKSYLMYDNREKSINKLIFDDHANLLWAGDTYGRVSSYDPTYSLYTRHTAHIGAMPVVDMLSHRSGLLSLSADSLNFANRHGVTQLNLTSADIAQLCDMRAMCFSSNLQNHVYCAGANLGSGIIDIDLQKGCLSSNTDYASKAKLMRSDNKIVAIGKQTGSIDLFDSSTNKLIRTVAGHSATISAMDLRDCTLVSAGKSRRFNTLCSDPFVNVFDLRMMSQLTPVAFSHDGNFGNPNSGGADFVHLHPVLPTVMAVASSSGTFDFIDLANPTLRSQYCHPCQSISQFELSPSGDYIAFIEHDNNINMWSRSNGMTGFSSSSVPLDYPDFVDNDMLAKKISIDDDSYPLSSVGMPYYNEKLLSAWSQVVFRSSGTIPRKIDASFTSATCAISNRASSSFPLLPYNKLKYGRRNVTRPYRSIRERKKKLLTTDEDGSDKEELRRYRPSNGFEVPPAYTKMQMVYGKYGVEDFDFKAFNNTEHSGLESDTDLAYTNAILQMYRFVPEVYNFVVSCLKDEDFAEDSLLTELGYLYDMMVKAKGIVCRSINFQEAVASNFAAKSIGLVTDSICDDAVEAVETLAIRDEDAGIVGNSYEVVAGSTLPQKFNEFLLSKIISEEVQRKINTTQSIALEELLGIHLDADIRSLSSCGSYRRQSTMVSTLSITSPATNNGKYTNKKLINHTILPYLESSMNRVKQRRVMCEKCHKYEIVECERTVRNLPPLLSLSLNLTNDEWTVAKTVRNWLVKDFYATISKDRPILKLQPTDLKTTNAIFKYDLNAYVARVTDDLSESHLVTYAKIFDETSNSYRWYMFNDFLVLEVDEEEALNISYWWKTPEILIYSDAEELRKPFVPVSTFKISDNILYRDHFANGIRENVKHEYKLLTSTEAPTPGTLVAIDAEFVILMDEKVEITCKGQRTLIKPKKTALARISVLRGEDGENFGVPFIDDYVVNTKHIENYVTRYSGIEPGDLDPKKSVKNLVMRQVVYRKIWLLLQLGCVFVGHGLYNDFRNINIYVPMEQIRDTALYYLQGRRYLALRYLAYALLETDVQKGNHDSIEDAYTALLLYKKYLELKAKNTFDHVLSQIYEEGRACGFKVPEERPSIIH
ncbi:LAFE_0C05534g1_1 [Lachancea fermentati]|uniref:PAN2-PAN3 deadenylation complex catalytic subunit PAN2 n=1 Tax=Lachancea fermentati TaxID=4955 RepID=A0A1G4M9F3_LACFM|nr:LAFE_0C05534g1_1 [Lachancea fermentati]